MNFSLQLNIYKKQNNKQSIRLRFFTSRKDNQYLDTKISVLKNQWDSKKQSVRRHPLEESLNASLTSLLNEVKKIFYKTPEISAKRLLVVYKNSKKYNSKSFLTFYQDVIDEMELKEKTRSAKTNQHYLDKLKKFSSYISFSDFSLEFAKEYELWMTLRGNKVNTIASNFKSIYAVLNKAVVLGVISKNPLKGYKIVSENVEKKSLTINEIQKIIDLIILPRHKGMIKARHMFLFSFYTAGMRFTDMCLLKWSNIISGNIVYTMNKSKTRAGSRRIIPLNKKSIEILEIYKEKNSVFIFPTLYGFEDKKNKEIEYRIYISNNNLNRALKIIDKSCGINKNMSMHMAKHSFTDYAVKNNVGLLMISKLLGHTKLATTEYYLKDFYHKEEGDIIKKLFN